MSEPVWTISWTQNYPNWEPIELPITDFAQAQEVLARIMSL
jgi:hypothetical protein